MAPVPNKVPANNVLYQFSVPPAHPEADNATVPVPHLTPSTPVGAVFGVPVTIRSTISLYELQPPDVTRSLK